jgi:hypothetical protein
METITLETLENLLTTHFHGELRVGRHEKNEECCALELLSVAQGLEWTDDPEAVRTFDLRPLNDIPVNNAVRTQHLLPVVAAYAGSLDWPLDRQQKVVNHLLIETVRQLLSNLPNLTEAVRAQCINASTVGEARLAVAAVAIAEVAWLVEAVAEVAAAAAAVARVTVAVASAMAEAAAEREWSVSPEAAVARAAKEAVAEARAAVFIAACEIWMEAVEDEQMKEGLQNKKYICPVTGHRMRIGEVADYPYPEDLEEGEVAYEVIAEEPEIYSNIHRESYLRKVLERADQEQCAKGQRKEEQHGNNINKKATESGVR